MTTQSNLKRRAEWMRKVSEWIVLERPELSGRLKWDTLSHFWNTGLSVQEAAERYLRAYSGIQ